MQLQFENTPYTMSIVNFRYSTLQPSALPVACLNICQTHWLVHIDVRWLSKRTVLDGNVNSARRLWISFAHATTNKLYEVHVGWTVYGRQIYFLCDSFGHLKTLNLEKLGREMSLADLVERNCAFKAKLMIFTTHQTTSVCKQRDNINESTFQLEMVDEHSSFTLKKH